MMIRIVPLLLFVAFFGSALFGNRQFGYRDGAHFYYPLYEYVQSELAAGRLPLWNPYENLGQPLAANPTTAVFYPGKLIFFLPFDYTTLYGWFVSGHVLLAAFFAYRLAKAWRCSTEAAILAGICYAFGGNVFFQHSNAPFLIGAAWFPEALLQVERMFRLKSYRNAAAWGTVLALMILGGDPQAAYHAILCAVGLFFITGRGRLRAKTQALVCGLAVMFGLAAVQILPAWELSRLSDRALPEHSDAVYLFSVPFWRLVEFFWPNAGGVQFPVNARWFNLFDNGDVWVPSFYMGLVPMLLAAWNIVFCFNATRFAAKTQANPQTGTKHSRRDIFLAAMLIVFVLGALGKWGGVYPLLNLLPGYGMFRFPAKLLTVAALSLAILAARGFDRLFPKNCDENRIYAFSFMYLLIHIGLLFGFGYIDKWIDFTNWSILDSSLFGPYQRWTANAIVKNSILQAFILPLFFWLLWIIYRDTKSLNIYKRLFVLIIAGDIFFTNRWMVATVPRIDFQEKSPLIELMREAGTAGPGSLRLRIYRFPTWYPIVFTACASEERLSEIVRWERATLSPKYSLSERISIVDVLGTMYPKDFYRIAGGLRWEIEHGEPGDLEKRLENLGVEFVVAQSGTELDAEKISLPAGQPDDCSLWKLRNPRQRNYAVFEPSRLEMDVELAEPGTVTVLEQYWPGWRAFADGKEYPIIPAEKLFRGVDLPSGNHRLIMLYDPLPLKIGAMLSALTILFLTCIILRSIVSKSNTLTNEFRRRFFD